MDRDGAPGERDHRSRQDLGGKSVQRIGMAGKHQDALCAVGGRAEVSGQVDAGNALARVGGCTVTEGTEGNGDPLLGCVGGQLRSVPRPGQHFEELLPPHGAGQATGGHRTETQTANGGRAQVECGKYVVHTDGEGRLADGADALALLLGGREVFLQDLPNRQPCPLGDLLVPAPHHRVGPVELQTVRLGPDSAAEQVAQAHDSSRELFSERTECCGRSLVQQNSGCQHNSK